MPCPRPGAARQLHRCVQVVRCAAGRAPAHPGGPSAVRASCRAARAPRRAPQRARTASWATPHTECTRMRRSYHHRHKPPAGRFILPTRTESSSTRAAESPPAPRRLHWQEPSCHTTQLMSHQRDPLVPRRVRGWAQRQLHRRVQDVRCAARRAPAVRWAFRGSACRCRAAHARAHRAAPPRCAPEIRQALNG